MTEPGTEPGATPPAPLSDQTATGLRWSAMSQIARQATTFLVSLVLARILGPESYGLVAMITIFTGFGTLFVDLGLGAGVIQRRELSVHHLGAVFWVNLSMGVFLAAVFVAGAPLLAWFYGEPELVSLTRASALNFIFGAVGTVHQALLTRGMRFETLAKIDIASTVIASGLSLVMAALGFGVWSLVSQGLIQSFFRAAAFWRFSSWRPTSPTFRGIRDLAAFSGNLFGFHVFNYWIRNADTLLVGRFLGSEAVGMYSRAYQLMLLPVQYLGAVAGNVMFPVLVVVQDDLPRVRTIYVRALASIHVVGAPIYAGLFSVADTFVFTVLGNPWAEMIPILRILCLCGFFQPAGHTTGWLYTATGRTDIMFRWAVGTGVLFVMGFIIGVNWGVSGVAWSYCFLGFALWYPGWTLAGGVIGLSFGDMLRPLIPATLCAVTMACLSWAIGQLLWTRAPVPVILTVQIFAGGISYAALIGVFGVTGGRELFELAGRRTKSKTSTM
jgi:O-antigen/teichoic acid export membrane protein